MSKNNKHDWKKVVKQEQSYICPVCGKFGTNKTMNIHHKIPKCKHGNNSRDNIVAWHIWCHKNYHEMWGNHMSDDFGNPI